MPAIPLPDEQSQQFLDQAEAQARAGLKGQFPEGLISPPTATAIPPMPRADVGSAPSAYALPVSGDPGPTSQPLDVDGPGPDAQPITAAPKAPTRFQGFWSTLANTAMQGSAEMGQGAGRLGVGLGSVAANALGVSTNTTDQWFKAVDDTFDPAVQYWQQAQQANEAAGNVGVGARIAGSAIGGALPFVLAPEAYIAADAMNTGANAVKQGVDVRTAYKLAAVNLVSNALSMKVPGEGPLVRRLAMGVLGVPALNAGTQELTKKVLASAGYKQLAAQINPLDPTSLATSGLVGLVFGALAGKGTHEGAQGAEPAPTAQPITAAHLEPDEEAPNVNEPPPTLAMAHINGADIPVQVAGDAGNGQSRVRLIDETGEAGEERVIPTAALRGAPAAAQPAGEIRLPGQQPGTVPEPSAAVPDHPSAEPLTDLQAQIADMKDPNTPRKAVYLSPDNVATLGPAGIAKLADGAKQIRNFDRKGGVLIVPDVATARMARDLRTGEPDMQKVLGQLTGAGDGKSPDKTAVVQGLSPAGAVASESAVRPGEIPGAVAWVAAEGKTPVVTTPEAAVVRRAALVGRERPPLRQEYDPAERLFEEQVAQDTDNAHTALAATKQANPDEALEPLGRGPWNPEADPLELRSPLEQLPDALAQLEQQETSAPGKKFPAKLFVRQDNASAFAGALKAAAIEAHGKAPDEAIQRAVGAARAAERLTHMTPEMVKKGMGTSHTRVSAIIDEMKKAARALMGKSEAGDELKISPKAAALRARLDRDAARAAKATEVGAKKPAVPNDSDVITVEPHVIRGREMQGLAQELGFDPDTILKEARASGERRGLSAFIRETAGGLGPNEGWLPYMSALNPLRSKASPLTRSEHIRLGNLIRRFAVADTKSATEARGDLDVFLNNIRGKRLDERTQAAVHEYAQARRRMELHKSDLADEEDTEPGESVYVENEESPAREGYFPEELDELRPHLSGVYADKLWGETARKLDEQGFTRQLEQLRDSGTPASLHGILDLAGRNAEHPVAQAIIHAIRSHVIETPVRFLNELEPPEGKTVSPSTAGLHLMGLGRNELQIRVNHPFAHPLRTILHEAVHAATSAHLRMEPLSEFSREIQQLWQTARDRTERMLGRPLAPTDYAKPHLYGLKNAKEFMAEALSSGAFQRHLIESEQFTTPGEKLRNILSRVGDAVRRLFGLKEGPEAKLFHNVLFATSRVMRAQGEKNEALARIFEPEHSAPTAHDALSTGDQLATLHDALEVEGPTRRFPGEERVMRDVPQALRPLVQNFRYWSGARADTVRKSVRAWASYDQLVRRGLRHFGSPDDPTNPLRQYDETRAQRATIQNRAIERSIGVAERWGRLSATHSRDLGQLMIDSTIWGIDPRKPLSEQLATVQGSTRAVRKYSEIAARWQAMTPEQRQVYTEAESDNRRMAKLARKTVIATVLRSVGSDISKAQRSLLYAVRDPRQWDDLISDGKPVDLGEFNTMVRETLKDLSPLTEMQGPYFHLGREGSKVVQVQPEGEKTFATKVDAQQFAGQVRELGPNSTARIMQDETGRWVVDYNARYVSMHRSAAEAEADAARMRRLGFDVGAVTEKQMSRETAPVTAGIRELLAEAERKIGRYGTDDAQGAATNEALLKTLRSAFAEMLAARSERAGGTLARRGVAGVKPEEMHMAYVRHVISSASHVGTMATLFDEANALGRLREAARNPEIGNAGQRTMYARGLLLHELSKRIRQDAEQRATGGAFTRALSHLTFLNYIVSPAHALIWSTQNVTTGIPVAGARYGYWRAARAFGKGMKSPALPLLRETLRGLIHPGSTAANDVTAGVLAALRRDPALVKWTQGENSPMQQLADRGALTSTLTNAMASLAHGGAGALNRAEEWARLLPHVADLFNRVSTAIAGLELTGGDVAKTADLIREIHVDYSPENKPRAFKELSRGPGKTLVLLKTYVQGMAHLLYTNVYDAATGAGKSRAEAAKTVAGLIAGAALFSGGTGAVPEPVRWLVDAWHHFFGSSDEYFDLDNTMRRWLSAALGETGGEIASEGLPRALGVDLSQRMGFAHMLFYDAPDLLGPQSPRDKAAQLIQSVLGPLYSMPVEHWQTFQAHARQGETAQAWLSLLPAKALNDAQKAYNLATKGYQTNSVSVRSKKISGWQDFMQSVGFRPEMAANAAERAQTVYQYRQWAFARKAAILQQYQRDPGGAAKAIEEWNSKNPGMLITRSDLIRAARGQVNAARLGAGLPGRDPVENQLLSY